ncbi:MAG: rhomboid family intramembrane serine protease [Gemmatimonadales bacterium]
MTAEPEIHPAVVAERDPHPMPVVTYTLLALCWLMGVITIPGGDDTFMLRLFHYGAKDNAAITGGEYWRLLTVAFLHGGYLHLAVNSWSLFQLGSVLEPAIGRVRFLATYFVSAVTGGLASWAFSPALGVGASGAIFGLAGAAVYLSWRGSTARLPSSLAGTLVAWAAVNLVLGFSIPTIDNAAHLGGLAGGLLCGVLLVSDLIAWPFVVAGIVTLGWAARAISTGDDHMAAAVAFLEAERADAADDTVTARRALARAPAFAPALVSGAFFQLRDGDNTGALALADSALRILADTGPVGRASRQGASAIGIEHRLLVARANLLRAWALFGLNLVDEGIISASIAKASPDPYTTDHASLLLGQAYLQKGQPEDALAHFRDAARSETLGVRGDAWSGAAQALAKLGRYREARQAVDKALVTDQKNEGYQALAAEMDSLLAAHPDSLTR